MRNFLFVFVGCGRCIAKQKIVGQSLMSRMTLWSSLSLYPVYKLCGGSVSSLTRLSCLHLLLLLWLRLWGSTAEKVFATTPTLARIKNGINDVGWRANYLAIKLVVPPDNFVCIFYGFSNAAKLFFHCQNLMLTTIKFMYDG